MQVLRYQAGASVSLNRYVGPEKRCELSSLPCGYHQRVGCKVKVRLLVVPCLDRREKVVAQPKVESQAGSHPEIVLRVERINRTVIIDGVKAGDGTGIGDSEQERGKGLSTSGRRRGIVGEVTAKAERAPGRG